MRSFLGDVNAWYPAFRPCDEKLFLLRLFVVTRKMRGDLFSGGLQVKKMNPTRLKELLKERDQSLQGSKKDLISRLLDWEKTNQA